MISKTLSTSVCYARLFEVCPDLAEFAQSLYPLLVSHADDFGREQGDPMTIKYRIHPRSPRSLEEFAGAMRGLHEVGLIVWYTAKGRECYQVCKFDEHQVGLHKRTRSTFPPIPGNSGNPPEPPGTLVTLANVPGQLKRRELKGTELNLTEENLTERRDRSSAVARTEPAPAPTKLLLELFDELHRRKIGHPARIVPGKDAKLLAELWKSHGDLVRPLVEMFFEQDTEFVHGAGYTVGVFAGQFSKLMTHHAELAGHLDPPVAERAGHSRTGDSMAAGKEHLRNTLRELTQEEHNEADAIALKGRS